MEFRGRRLFVDGVERKEEYVKYLYGDVERPAFGPYTVPEDHILVFGDNRDNSSDSRYWGPVNRKYLRGKALFIYFSLDYEKHWIRFSRIGDIIR